jgi:hypothetical protein
LIAIKVREVSAVIGADALAVMWVLFSAVISYISRRTFSEFALLLSERFHLSRATGKDSRWIAFHMPGIPGGRTYTSRSDSVAIPIYPGARGMSWSYCRKLTQGVDGDSLQALYLEHRKQHGGCSKWRRCRWASFLAYVFL